MIATGLLKDLKNTELRNRIAIVPLRIEAAQNWDTDPMGSLRAAVNEVARAVDFGFHSELPEPREIDAPDTSFEDGISVNYVLEELLANRTLKNVFIEAADTHLDMWRNHRGACRKFEEIQSLLAEMNRR